jgi:hypothetical protein
MAEHPEVKSYKLWLTSLGPQSKKVSFMFLVMGAAYLQGEQLRSDVIPVQHIHSFCLSDRFAIVVLPSAVGGLVCLWFAPKIV